MKKILSLLGTITLIGTSTTSLVACNKPQYSEDELKKEKEKNNININGNILEWIAPQKNHLIKLIISIILLFEKLIIEILLSLKIIL